MAVATSRLEGTVAFLFLEKLMQSLSEYLAALASFTVIGVSRCQRRRNGQVVRGFDYVAYHALGRPPLKGSG